MQVAPDLLRRIARTKPGGPLYRQIYARIRGGILSGERCADARLPSARSLASQLAVARGTAETAYQILPAEGYIAGRGPRSPFVHRALVNPSAPTLRPGRAEATTPCPQ